LIGAANAYIEEQEPWKLYKSEETEKVFTVLGDCLETLRIVALLALPIIPNASNELWRRLGLDTDINQERFPEAAQWGRGPSGTQVISGDPLFPRLEVS
jgi:methionyl-tRNA synthetase